MEPAPDPIGSVTLSEFESYNRRQLKDLLSCDDEFISILVELFGLLPLAGTRKIYAGRNVLRSLARHARSKVIVRRYNPMKREDARRLMRERKRDRDAEEA